MLFNSQESCKKLDGYRGYRYRYRSRASPSKALSFLLLLLLEKESRGSWQDVATSHIRQIYTVSWRTRDIFIDGCKPSRRLENKFHNFGVISPGEESLPRPCEMPRIEWESWENRTGENVRDGRSQPMTREATWNNTLVSLASALLRC